ncbi:MAG: potassium-transporting ATPase subunit KdpA [Ignavibacteria bacterium]|nr:potassium-transporting ATPase subunit KdpA [Ignavibacteria bacterium]
MQGNPNITAMGIQQTMGNMEAKRNRLGSGFIRILSIITTVISAGSVNAMYDSFNCL